MNMTALTSRRGAAAQPTGEQVSLGSYTTYAEAQSVVDYLADHHFEVETIQIMGSDLRMVEQITGRLTWARAIVAGMASGAWLGVFVGLLLSILDATTFLRAVAWGLTWGVLFGGAFAAGSYGLSGGRRDFTSRTRRYPVASRSSWPPRTASTPALCSRARHAEPVLSALLRIATQVH